MSESFAAAALVRIRQARLDLDAARAEGDAYAAACAADEVDDAIRIAVSLGLDVKPGGEADGSGRG